MTLTANEIIRIMKIARYKAYRKRMGFDEEPWSKYSKFVEEEMKESEEGDSNE